MDLLNRITGANGNGHHAVDPPAPPQPADLPPDMVADLATLAAAGKPLSVVIRLGDVVATLSVIVGGRALGDDRADDGPFVMTALQEDIMKVLQGKAMRTDALAVKCDVDRRQLYREGGLKELQSLAYVSWHRRLGYYREDEPPPELVEARLREAAAVASTPPPTTPPEPPAQKTRGTRRGDDKVSDLQARAARGEPLFGLRDDDD